MADQKLTQLPALASLSADDLFYVVDDPAGAATSNKMTASVLDAKYLQVANNLSDLANAATARGNLGLGSAAVQNSSAFATAAQGTLADSALQLDDIGVIVQAWDSDLNTIAGLAKTDGNFIVGDGVAWVVESGATARASLGLGTIATQAANSVSITGGSITGITDLAIADGGTGQSTALGAINALTAVAGATNEHVLTKDTATGNAIFKAAGSGSSLPVADTQTIVMGSADNTKLLRFEVDGFTAGATRVMTPPNQDTLLAGQNFANTFTEVQIIQAALAITRTPNAFGTSNNFTAFVVGDLTGATANNGGLYAIARRDKSNEAFVALSGWDDGNSRQLYFGGGGWGAPDATEHTFWTAPTYSESNDTGVLTLLLRGGRAGVGPLGSLNHQFNVYKPSGSTYMQIRNDAAGGGTSDGFFFGVDSAASQAEIWGGTGLPLVFYAHLAEVARFDNNSTAGNTRFMIYDVDNGTVERVSVGAADSGGVGFKYLRIPN